MKVSNNFFAKVYALSKNVWNAKLNTLLERNDASHERLDAAKREYFELTRKTVPDKIYRPWMKSHDIYLKMSKIYEKISDVDLDIAVASSFKEISAWGVNDAHKQYENQKTAVLNSLDNLNTDKVRFFIEIMRGGIARIAGCIISKSFLIVPINKNNATVGYLKQEINFGYEKQIFYISPYTPFVEKDIKYALMLDLAIQRRPNKQLYRQMSSIWKDIQNISEADLYDWKDNK